MMRPVAGSGHGPTTESDADLEDSSARQPGRAKRHTDRAFERQLADLRELLLAMAGRVEHMISNAVRALVHQDVTLARDTIDSDHDVNRAEVESDELCLQLLAMRQPMASDLRFITLALKMVTDLERIGDLAVNISERVVDLDEKPQVCAYDDLQRMADLVQGMVRDAIDAFVQRDAARAERVIANDDEVDHLYHHTFRELLALMGRDPSTIERGIHVQSVAKWLERIGDHATNLAEQVVFMVRGKDIRHIGKRGSE